MKIIFAGRHLLLFDEHSSLFGRNRRCLREIGLCLANIHHCLNEIRRCSGENRNCLNENHRCLDVNHHCLNEIRRCLGDIRHCFFRKSRNLYVKELYSIPTNQNDFGAKIKRKQESVLLFMNFLSETNLAFSRIFCKWYF